MGAVTFRIRCKDCGYEADSFRGWAFASRCGKPGQPSLLHNWERVPVLDTFTIGLPVGAEA